MTREVCSENWLWLRLVECVCIVFLSLFIPANSQKIDSIINITIARNFPHSLKSWPVNDLKDNTETSAEALNSVDSMHIDCPISTTSVDTQAANNNDERDGDERKVIGTGVYTDTAMALDAFWAAGVSDVKNY